MKVQGAWIWIALLAAGMCVGCSPFLRVRAVTAPGINSDDINSQLEDLAREASDRFIVAWERAQKTDNGELYFETAALAGALSDNKQFVVNGLRTLKLWPLAEYVDRYYPGALIKANPASVAGLHLLGLHLVSFPDFQDSATARKSPSTAHSLLTEVLAFLNDLRPSVHHPTLDLYVFSPKSALVVLKGGVNFEQSIQTNACVAQLQRGLYTYTLQFANGRATLPADMPLQSAPSGSVVYCDPVFRTCTLRSASFTSECLSGRVSFKPTS